MAERAPRQGDWLPITAAWARILSQLAPLPAEPVPLADALGCTLAEDVTTPVEHPPWDNSAMDGYAVRAADIGGASAEHPARLVVVEDIPAGVVPTRAVGAGEAARIMTGAPVPEGADTVVRVEHTDAGTDVVLIRSAADSRRNIRRRGEDVRTGEVVLRAGDVLAPGAIGLLAMVGRSTVRVHRRPRVAILATGDELAGADRIDEVLAGRKIADSNSPMTAALLRAAGCEPLPLGIATDDRASLRAHLERARGADALITTAGASVGEHDLVKDVLEEMGYRTDFWRVRMRPGSPFSFGRLGDLPVFGVAGNPVSVLVTFEVLVRPALRRLLGERAVYPRLLEVTTADRIPGVHGLTYFPRLYLAPDGAGRVEARLTGPQGSGVLSSVARADALAVIPQGTEAIAAGERIMAIPLRPTEGAALGDAGALAFS